MSEAILYDYWRSTASYRVRIAMGVKQVEFESVAVDLESGEQRGEAFRKVNPQGLVPFLQIDGISLCQSLAMIEYLEETRPDPPLLPSDSAGRARVRSMAYVIAMDIHPINAPRVANRAAGLVGGDPETRLQWMIHFMTEGFSALESMLSQPESGRFCHGDSVGFADLCLVAQLYNANRWGIDLSPYSRIRSVAEACEPIPAFQAAHPDRFKPSGVDGN